jgi:hypothetical protein
VSWGRQTDALKTLASSGAPGSAIRNKLLTSSSRQGPAHAQVTHEGWRPVAATQARGPSIHLYCRSMNLWGRYVRMWSLTFSPRTSILLRSPWPMPARAANDK